MPTPTDLVVNLLTSLPWWLYALFFTMLLGKITIFFMTRKALRLAITEFGDGFRAVFGELASTPEPATPKHPTPPSPPMRSAKIRKPARHSTPETPKSITAMLDCTLAPNALLNGEEHRLNLHLEDFIDYHGLANGLRLYAQVSLDEIIHVRNAPCGKTRHSARNGFAGKRVDFLIVDEDNMPVLGIEYQGSGHYQGNAKQRDEVKQIAFELANIPLLAIHVGYDWACEETRLLEALDLS